MIEILIENKEKGNLALKEIIESELEDNQNDIYNLVSLLYEIQDKYPHVPTIQKRVGLAGSELIRYANKYPHQKKYFETLTTAVLYLKWVYKDIKKHHHKNIKDYFDVPKIYEKREKLREIGKEISENFSFRDIFLSHKNFTIYPILTFMLLNYKDYIKDIDMIIAIAYQLVNIKTKNVI